MVSKNTRFPRKGFPGKHDKNSPYYESVRLTYRQCEEGVHHFNTAIGIIKAIQSGFSETHEIAGVLFCDKYLLRLHSQKAFTERNLHELQNSILAAQALVIEAQVKGLYRPAHSKTYAYTLWKYAIALLKKGLHDGSQKELSLAEKVVLEVKHDHPDYFGADELLFHIQTALRQAQQ